MGAFKTSNHGLGDIFLNIVWQVKQQLAVYVGAGVQSIVVGLPFGGEPAIVSQGIQIFFFRWVEWCVSAHPAVQGTPSRLVFGIQILELGIWLPKRQPGEANEKGDSSAELCRAIAKYEPLHPFPPGQIALGFSKSRFSPNGTFR